MIVLITKVLCYHQVYVADDLYNKYGDDFFFVQMREPLDWRVKNKQEGFDRPYLVSYQKQSAKAIDLIKKANVIIFGEAPLKLIRYKRKDCLLFKMSENIFKNSQFKIGLFGKFKRWLSYKYLKTLTNNRHSYLLSCSGFAVKDYNHYGLYKNNALKWGYFPLLPQMSKDAVFEKFENLRNIELVWVSRLVKYKNPLFLINLIEYLLSKNIHSFHVTVVGNSDESDIDYYKHMTKYINNHNLLDYITMVGKVNADQVFDYYKKSHIALFTSDESEGWGVGINEAMSCGCAIVSSNVIGAAPFLINKMNGIVFQNNSTEDFCQKVETLISNRNIIKNMAEQGFNDIQNMWNHKIAAERLSAIIDSYLKQSVITPYEKGPCSIAPLLDYDWYREK